MSKAYATFLVGLVWAGRVLAVLALFTPYGLLWGAMVLLLAEGLNLVRRVAGQLEAVVAQLEVVD